MKTASVFDLKPILNTANPQDPTAPVILDIRTPEEFSDAHIPGSLNIPLQDLLVDGAALGEKFAKAPAVYVVCRTGNRVGMAYQMFGRKLPEKFIWIVDTGLLHWAQAGEKTDS